MLTIRRRLLAVTALTVLALAQIIPASANAQNMSSGGCYGTGQTWVYATTVASATVEGSGYLCYLHLNAEANIGYWYTYASLSGYPASQMYDRYYGAAVPGFASHLLGPGDWTTDGAYTSDT